VKLRIATRKSALALAQTRWVGARIRERHPDVEIEEVGVVTEGDRVLDKPLMSIGGKGLFVSEVEQCIVDGRADIAVHSMKDVPAALAEGLGIVCVPPREDPRDLLVTAEGIEIDALAAGAKVGTSSLRRSAQLKAHRPDLAFATLRGNVGTRLQKLAEGGYDAIVLAAAGVKRLDLAATTPHWVIPEEICIPAVGQGILGIEARLDDARVMDLLGHIEDATARVELEAERAFLTKLEGNCKVPLAGHAKLTDGGARLTMHGMVSSLDGSTILTGAGDRYLSERGAARIEAARNVGLEIAEGLLSKGAATLIRDAIAAVERSLKQGNGGGSGNYGKWS
jgi:hydroxymethylbilane synthase